MSRWPFSFVAMSIKSEILELIRFHNTIVGRQRGRVVRVSDSKSSGPGFEYRSGHYLDLFHCSLEFKSSATL